MRNATTRTLLLTTLASSLLLYIGAQSEQLRREAVRSEAEARIQTSSAESAPRGGGASLVDKRLVARALDFDGKSIANRSRVVVMADTRVPLAPTDLLVTPGGDDFERTARAERLSDDLDTRAARAVE